MATLTSALEIGKSALNAQQIGLNVTGNNIANVNTPGYARKTPNLVVSPTVAELGTGVTVASLIRANDLFLDTQFRYEVANVGRIEAVEQAMTTVEAIFTEMAGGGATEPGAVFNQPGGAALSGAFSRFFNAFQDLANNPESDAARAAVREEAVFLTVQFHRMDDQLSALRTDLEGEFQDTVDEANELTRNIANVNAKIIASKRDPDDVAGDLEDERDRLIDDLSRLVNLRVREESDGTFTLTTSGGVLLVSRALSNDLATRTVVREGAVVSDLSLASTGQAVSPTSGRLSGLAAARDERIPSYQSSLNLLAETLVTEVNTVHAAGFGLDGSSGNLFFDATRTTAREIAISDAVLSDLDKIAAAGPIDASPFTSAGPGDGSNALALSDIRLEKVLGGGTQTIEEFYSDLVGLVGAEAKEVLSDAGTQRLVMEQIETRRENVRGVSLNEEATNLILFQRAYQAAARIVTIVDEMMQSVLDM